MNCMSLKTKQHVLYGNYHVFQELLASEQLRIDNRLIDYKSPQESADNLAMRS